MRIESIKIGTIHVKVRPEPILTTKAPILVAREVEKCRKLHVYMVTAM